MTTKPRKMHRVTVLKEASSNSMAAPNSIMLTSVKMRVQ